MSKLIYRITTDKGSGIAERWSYRIGSNHPNNEGRILEILHKVGEEVHDSDKAVIAMRTVREHGQPRTLEFDVIDIPKQRFDRHQLPVRLLVELGKALARLEDEPEAGPTTKAIFRYLDRVRVKGRPEKTYVVMCEMTNQALAPPYGVALKLEMPDGSHGIGDVIDADQLEHVGARAAYRGIQVGEKVRGRRVYPSRLRPWVQLRRPPV